MGRSDSSTTSTSFDVLNYTTGPATPGDFTHGVLAMFPISFREISYEFPLAIRDAQYLEGHRAVFLASLDRLEADDPSTLPKSTAVLAFQFLEFLLDRKVSPTLLAHLFRAVRIEVMEENDVHGFISQLSDGSEARTNTLRTYLRLSAISPPVPRLPHSSLFSAATEGDASILMAFGGQGAMNPVCIEELAELYSVYQPFVEPLIATVAPLLQTLSNSPDARFFYSGRDINLRGWLSNPNSRPEKSFISEAAVSFPIIGLIDLMHYCIICKTIGKTPGEVRNLLHGVTGHSQGIVVATAVSKSDSWESFLSAAKWAIEFLFWTGLECHEGAPQSPLSLSAVKNSMDQGDGTPSHLLVVRGLQQKQLETIIGSLNHHLEDNERLQLALINGPKNYVIAGTPRSLRGLTLRIHKIRAPDGLDQSRIPFSKRKTTISCQFLPISAPFHSAHLSLVAERLKSRFSNGELEPFEVDDLKIATFHTETGLDIRHQEKPTTSVAHILVDAIATRLVDWPKALQIGQDHRISHVVVLGGGRFSDLVHQTVDGLGIRVIDGTSTEGSDLVSSGTKTELFVSNLDLYQLKPKSWQDKYQPRILHHNSGDVVIETRLNSILNAPPIITAGMTPTTVHWDFCSAVIRAGYHVELAGGGYRDAKSMTNAIEKLAASIPIGRGITCNLIYVSPASMAWQIPMIRQLIQRGVPIEGLTIGAGVPSTQVAAEYIETLGLKHISFKPGSLSAIRDVIAIAKSHPSFPVILQWTGGRGGGHHSCEDFHEPLLETYSDIRRCPNLYLVVGSGFGDSSGIYPYFTGEWATEFGRPAMPCDGVLLGSRMMVAREAHTSPQAKALLIKATGANNVEWEASYSSPAGGVLTVTSEMGQPIHKLATRGVRFWKEMDDTIFSLPRPERKAALLKRKDAIIQRLNADFAKPWFGQSSTGKAIDLEDMSYAEVLSRLIKLMYVQHQKRWIDPSYCDLVVTFAARAWERLASSHNQTNWNPSWLDTPQETLSRMVGSCPNLESQLLHPEDVQFFINSCKARGRKPVNFIVALDDDFEVWFKKDSLWQSEDVDAVLDQDPERVCILQSPVSVRYATRDNQSAKEILDEIHDGLVRFAKDSQLPSAQKTVSPSDGQGLDELQSESISVEETETHKVFRTVSDRELPEHAIWLDHLERHISPAITALLTETAVFGGGSGANRCQPNPFYQIFAPQHGLSVHCSHEKDEIHLLNDKDGCKLVDIYARDGNSLNIHLYHYDSVPSGPAVLTLDWDFDERSRHLFDKTQNRDQAIQAFYAHLWLAQKHENVSGQVTDTFHGQEVILSKRMHQMLHSVISRAFADSPSVYPGLLMPMEAAVIAAWEVLMKPLLLDDLQFDLLRLVHRSMSMSYEPGMSPLQVDDAVSSQSFVRSIIIEPTGISITVEAYLVRSGQRIATLVSEFFVKGEFSDYSVTFRKHEEPEIELKVDSDLDEAVLRGRKWLHLDNPREPLEGMTLVFQLTTLTTWKDQATIATVQTKGKVLQKLWNGTKREIASVAFSASESRGNPVTEFLQRKGKIVSGKVALKNPGWDGEAERTVTAPLDSHPYAAVSGDCNPIHVSSVFAEVAGLPGPITHGMYTAAVCRKVVEDLVVEGDVERLRSFTASFVGMVRPGDKLSVSVSHTAMKNGLMVIEVVARVAATGEKVLQGEAEVKQPPTAYLFTGQGTQSKGMGMALYESSPVAKALWDDMDRFLLERYGWSILDIIQRNPKELTIHFRGPQGRIVLENYLAMKTEVRSADGSRHFMPVIPGLTPETTSYTFSEARGLLHATQFAQPAILLLEKSTVEDMRANGLVPEGAVFAGHSLGEYGALYSMADFAEFKNLLSIGFYRGLMMQFAVERDELGRTGYSMVAVNPGRVGKYFDENALRVLVDQISRESGQLMEIVNFNVEGEQYVCAGHVRNLYTITETLNMLSTQKNGASLVREFLVGPDCSSTTLGREVVKHVTKSQGFPLDMELRRGRATIPLAGIDMPFHSERLRPGIAAFREFLHRSVKVSDIRSELMVGKWIPNVVGKPFSLEKSYLDEAADITQSSVLRELAGQVC